MIELAKRRSRSQLSIGCQFALIVLLVALEFCWAPIFVTKRHAELAKLDELVRAASIQLFTIRILQSVVLAALCLSVWRFPSRILARTALVAMFVLIGLDLAAPTDGDAFAYVGYAKFSRFVDAYQPPDRAFTGSFAAINVEWGTPMHACPYGPLWLALDRLFVGWVPSLHAGVLVVKLAASAAFVALVFVLRRLGAADSTLVALTANPAMIGDFAGGGHNDLFPVLLCIGAYIAVRSRRGLLGVMLAASAGLMKLPFCAVALVAFGGDSRLRARIVMAAATLGVAFVLSALLGGHAYRAALHQESLASGILSGGDHVRGTILHAATAVFALCTIAFVVLKNARWPAAIWAFGALGASLYSWYLAWAIPYVVLILRSPFAAAYFISWSTIAALEHTAIGKFNSLLFLLTPLFVFALKLGWRPPPAAETAPANAVRAARRDDGSAPRADDTETISTYKFLGNDGIVQLAKGR